MVSIQTHRIAPNITRAMVVSCTSTVVHPTCSTMRILNRVAGKQMWSADNSLVHLSTATV